MRLKRAEPDEAWAKQLAELSDEAYLRNKKRWLRRKPPDGTANAWLSVSAHDRLARPVIPYAVLTICDAVRPFGALRKLGFKQRISGNWFKLFSTVAEADAFAEEHAEEGGWLYGNPPVQR